VTDKHNYCAQIIIIISFGRKMINSCTATLSTTDYLFYQKKTQKHIIYNYAESGRNWKCNWNSKYEADKVDHPANSIAKV